MILLSGYSAQLTPALENTTEIIRPHERFKAALQKLFLFDSTKSPAQLRTGFNIPFNTMFMPAEYVSINCCPECYFDGDEWYCPPCFPPPDPPVPTDSRITTTVSSFPLLVGEPPCAPPFAGWHRVVHKIVIDQYGADIFDFGAQLTETVTISTPNDLNISGTTVGTATTSITGEFQDTFFVCSALCPASTGATNAIQTITDLDFALYVLNPVTIRYSCSGITANGQ